MAVKCNLITQEDKDLFVEGLYSLTMEYQMEELTLDLFKNEFNKEILRLAEEFVITDTSEATDLIYNTLKDLGIVELSTETFNPLNINNLITGAKLGILPDNLAFSAELASPKESELIQLRLNVTAQFLDNAYGMVAEARMLAQNIANRHLFDALFINRGSIKTENGEEITGIVKTPEDLNENVRRYQQLLLNQVVAYLNNIVNNAKELEITPEQKEALANPILYKDRLNTGVLTVLKPLLKYLSTDIFKSNTDPTGTALDGLRSLYNLANNRSDPKQKEAKLQLDAYNANVILLNFDQYLHVTLGDIIDIQDFGTKTGANNKYAIAGKTAKLLTTWSNSEDRDIEGEADFVTKLAINTTPFFNRKAPNTDTGKFLTFADYLYLIGKIKDLSWNEDVINTVFGEINPLTGKPKYGTVNQDFWNSLHEDTLKAIIGKRLSSIINTIRRNPRKWLPIIYEIITNEHFLRWKSNIFSTKTFSESDLNKLFSLNKGIFGIQEKNSLYNLSTMDADVDYFAFITQTADTIFNVKYVQYYRDSDGILLVRTLISQDINNLRRTIETTINTANSIRTIKDFNEYKKSLNINPVSENEITFVIPGTNLQARVHAKSSSVTFSENGKPADLSNYWDLAPIQLFLDSKLRLGIYLNIDLQNALKEATNSINSTANLVNRLLSFASRIVLNQYVVNNSINPNNSIEDLEKELSRIYGDNAPKYNRQLDIIESVTKLDIPILRDIATAKANVAGITTATQVKDGSGNGQSLLTQSRLLGSHLSLFELLERQTWSEIKDSATRDCLILNVTGLYEGVFTAKEYYDDLEGSKSFVDMCVSEFAYSSFMLDYIGGLVTRAENDNSLVGDGHVMFLPSVNSDKGTIGRIMINLNKLATTQDGITKPLREFNHQELRLLIAKLFGTIYTRMYEAVNQDWLTLQNFCNSNPNLPNIPPLDYLTDFQEFNKWWVENRTRVEIRDGKEVRVGIYEKNPSEFIKNVTLAYNKTHRLHPLTLIDLTHFRVKTQKIRGEDGKYIADVDGGLAANLVLISQIARYNPQALLDLGIDPNTYPDEKTFWNLKHKEVLKGLIKSRFEVNTTGKLLQELQYLRSNYPSWINLSGNVVLAKVNWNGKIINITAARDLIRFLQFDELTFQDIIDNVLSSDLITLNPTIETWNYLDYLFTLEFMNCTVGSFINHPEKSGSNKVLVQEAAQFQAQHKRNVSFTAAMHEFQLNLLNGICEEYNVAVIDDIHDEQGTIMGLLNNIKPFDGATFVNPFVVILENNSLGGARAGITKKQFVHFKNERTGGGGIIKTAGFGLNNDWIRNSPFLQLMMRKMTRHIWLNEDSSPAIVDITRNYKGNSLIQRRDSNGNPIVVEGNPLTYKNMYFMLNGKAYEIVDIKNVGLNQYQRTLRELLLDSEGKPIVNSEVRVFTEATVPINNNYDLWNFFGGDRSMSVDSTGHTLEYSNSSVENVVKAMNNTAGLDTNGNVITRNGVSVANIKTQDDLWQPMKLVDVHYLATAGAVKQGGANINSVSRYADEVDYDTQRIKMYQAGVQLDKEHHADDAELSLMTQVISACAAKGYTFEAATLLYDALRKSTEIGIREHLNGVKEYIKSGDPRGVLEAMYEAIIHSLGTAKLNQTNFAYLVASDLIRLARESKKVLFADAALPLSDNTMRNKIFSVVASYLTNAGIKQKIPGILSVLTPSHNIFLLHTRLNPTTGLLETVKFEAYSNPAQEAALAQAYLDANPVFIDEVDVPIFVKDGEINADLNTFQVPDLTYIRLRDMPKPWRSDPTRINQTRRVYVKGAENKGYFEVVKDEEDGFYSVHFKPVDKNNPNAFTKEEKLLLFEAVAGIIPNGAKVSTWGTVSKGGISGINRLANLGFTQIGTRTLKRRRDNTNNISNLELGRTYKITRLVTTQIAGEDGLLHDIVVPVEEKRLIRTPLEYHKLKELIHQGLVTRVVEAVYNEETGKPIGRDLAAYNVRFLTLDGQSFLLWDLDSAVALYELNDVRNSKKLTAALKNARLQEIKDWLFPGHNFPLKDLEKRVRRMLLKDLMNLSLSTPDIMKLYNAFLQTQSTFLSAIPSSQIDINTISNNTASFGVLLANGSKDFWNKVNDWLKNNPYGIVAYRKYGDKPNTFSVNTVNEGWIGNPFSTDIRGASTVQLFYEWLVTGNNFRNYRATEEFRQAIINKILNTPSDANIFYYTELNRPSHATVIGYLVKHKELLQLSNKPQTNTTSWYDRYAQWVNIYLGTGNGSELHLPGFDGRVTAENFAQVEPLVRQTILNTTKVRVGNQLLDVDRNSIKVLAYELIMPKTFATNFGLKLFDDLASIQNNPDWFVELYRKNSEVKVNANNYSVALKTSTGNHTYLLSKSLLNSVTSDLQRVDEANIGKLVVDGKTLRLDSKGGIMYELTDDFELWRDGQGNDVIVTDKLTFYMNNTSCESVLLSESLLNRTTVFRDILTLLGKSKNKTIKYFSRYINNKYNLNKLDLIYLSNLEYNLIPEKGSKDYEKNRIVRAAREKHSSFLKALDVVMTRTPALSMLSFMAMRVVAFDNPDLNNAYVSTLLILLQGSDYDIDAASIATFDIDRHGKLLLWSPYADLRNLEMLEASMELPIPTGRAIELKEGTKLIPTREFFRKYASLLLNIYPYLDADGNISPTEVDVPLHIETVEDLKLLAEFLKESETLEIPAKRYWELFINYLNEDHLFGRLLPTHVPSLFARLKEIVDEHNLYFESLSSYRLSKVVNNSTMNGMYKVSKEPVNLTEGHVPVDATTGPLKEIAKKSAEDAEASTRTSGNVINKFEGINENLVGKKGISICATGLKSYFGLTQYCNWVLNNGTIEDLERLLLGSDHQGIRIWSKKEGKYKTYKTLANIRALDLNTIKNSELFAALSEVTLDEDVALTLSALLSLATDRK